MSNLFTLNWPWAAAVLGMAVVTYAARISGLLLLSGVEVKGRWKAALDSVPVSVMMAVITPSILMTGRAESLSAVIVAIAAYFRAPLVLNILLGMGSVVLLRHWL
ncbi:MAG: AzlD domain-containing protein [Aestuariivirga sp.]